MDTETVQHTPGPWEVMPLSKWVVARDGNGHSILIAELYPDSGQQRGALAANAELIASAPKLKADRDALLEAAEAIRVIPALRRLRGGACPGCGRQASHKPTCAIEALNAAIEQAKA